jgi:hypothetical protein
MLEKHALPDGSWATVLTGEAGGWTHYVSGPSVSAWALSVLPAAHPLALAATAALQRNRQQGLWREGSYAISPGRAAWPFAPGAWALYRRCDALNATRFSLRVKPLAAARTVALALGSPAGTVATFSAAAAAAPPDAMAVYDVPLDAPLSAAGADLFLVFDGAAVGGGTVGTAVGVGNEHAVLAAPLSPR